MYPWNQQSRFVQPLQHHRQPGESPMNNFGNRHCLNQQGLFRPSQGLYQQQYMNDDSVIFNQGLDQHRHFLSQHREFDVQSNRLRNHRMEPGVQWQQNIQHQGQFQFGQNFHRQQHFVSHASLPRGASYSGPGHSRFGISQGQHCSRFRLVQGNSKLRYNQPVSDPSRKICMEKKHQNRETFHPISFDLKLKSSELYEDTDERPLKETQNESSEESTNSFKLTTTSISNDGKVKTASSSSFALQREEPKAIRSSEETKPSSALEETNLNKSSEDSRSSSASDETRSSSKEAPSKMYLGKSKSSNGSEDAKSVRSLENITFEDNKHIPVISSEIVANEMKPSCLSLSTKMTEEQVDQVAFRSTGATTSINEMNLPSVLDKENESFEVKEPLKQGAVKEDKDAKPQDKEENRQQPDTVQDLKTNNNNELDNHYKELTEIDEVSTRELNIDTSIINPIMKSGQENSPNLSVVEDALAEINKDTIEDDGDLKSTRDEHADNVQILSNECGDASNDKEADNVPCYSQKLFPVLKETEKETECQRGIEGTEGQNVKDVLKKVQYLALAEKGYTSDNVKVKHMKGEKMECDDDWHTKDIRNQSMELTKTGKMDKYSSNSRIPGMSVSDTVVLPARPASDQEEIKHSNDQELAAKFSLKPLRIMMYKLDTNIESMEKDRKDKNTNKSTGNVTETNTSSAEEMALEIISEECDDTGKEITNGEERTSDNSFRKLTDGTIIPSDEGDSNQDLADLRNKTKAFDEEGLDRDQLNVAGGNTDLVEQTTGTGTTEDEDEPMSVDAIDVNQSSFTNDVKQEAVKSNSRDALEIEEAIESEPIALVLEMSGDSDDIADDDESDDDVLNTAPAFLKSIDEVINKPLPVTPEKSRWNSSQRSAKDCQDSSMEYHSPLAPQRRKMPFSKSRFTLDNLLADHVNTFEQEKTMDEIKSELKADIQQGGFVNILNREEAYSEELVLEEDQQEKLKQFKIEESKICYDRPGMNIFENQQYLCLFAGSIHPTHCGFSLNGNSQLSKHLATVNPVQYQLLLTTSVISLCFSKLPCQDAVLRWLFLLMSVERNDNICRRCETLLQEVLHKHHKQLKCFPGVYDLLSILVNYGADLETLVPNDLVSHELVRSKLQHQPDYQKGRENTDSSKARCYRRKNLFMVLKFMALSMYRKSVTMSGEEITVLLVVLCKASLDTTLKHSCGVDAFQTCVAMAVNLYSDPDWEKHRLKLSRLLSSLTDHHHNMASIAELLPKTGARGFYLQRAVGYSMLSGLLKSDSCLKDLELNSIQISQLHEFVGPMKELLINNPYKLSSVVTILDICVGVNLKSTEREDLKELIELINNIRVQDNVSVLDRTRVKDMLVRLTSSWALDVQTMKRKQTKIFEYAVHESPVKLKIETVDTRQLDIDTASDSQSDDEEMPRKMLKL